MIHPANAILAAVLGYLVKGSNAESHYTLKYRQSKPGGNAVRRATKLRGMRHLSINKGRTLAILKDRTQALAPRGGEKGRNFRSGANGISGRTKSNGPAFSEWPVDDDPLIPEPEVTMTGEDRPSSDDGLVITGDDVISPTPAPKPESSPSNEGVNVSGPTPSDGGISPTNAGENSPSNESVNVSGPTPSGGGSTPTNADENSPSNDGINVSGLAPSGGSAPTNADENSPSNDGINVSGLAPSDRVSTPTNTGENSPSNDNINVSGVLTPLDDDENSISNDDINANVPQDDEVDYSPSNEGMGIDRSGFPAGGGGIAGIPPLEGMESEFGDDVFNPPTNEDYVRAGNV